jgi:hypothetical protein
MRFISHRGLNIQTVKKTKDRWNWLGLDTREYHNAIKRVGGPIELKYFCDRCGKEAIMLLNTHWTDSWRIGAYVLMEWMLKERRARDLTSE